MREIDYSIPPHRLPVWLIPLSIIMLIVPLFPYVFANGVQTTLNNVWAVWLLPVFVVMILAHEAVHAIAWKYASKLSWSQFKFGFAWKALAPYCHAKAPMSVRAYRIGAIMPSIITGLIPLIIAYLLNSPPMMLVGGVMISAAVGDVFVLWTVRNVPENAQLLDHSSHVGCIALIPETNEG